MKGINLYFRIVLILSAMSCESMQVIAQNQHKQTSSSLTVKLGEIVIASNVLRLVVVNNYVYPSFAQNVHTAVEATGKDGIFKFSIPPVDQIAYFMIMIPYDSTSNNVMDRIGDDGLIENGDSIVMEVNKWPVPSSTYSKYHIQYSGHGSQKLVILDQMRQAEYLTSGSGLLMDSSFKLVQDNYTRIKTAAMLDILTKYKKSLTTIAYDQLLVDVSYQYGANQMNDVRYAWQRARKQGKVDLIKTFMDSVSQVPLIGTETARTRSKSFAAYLVRKALIQQLLTGQVFTYAKLYDRLKLLSERTRDRTIIELFAHYNPAIQEMDSLVMDAKHVIKKPPYVQYLDQFGHLKVGAMAHPLILPDMNGQLINMQTFKGRVVFLDFWFTGCKACIEYYRDVLDSVHAYFHDNPQVVFLSISVDKSKSVWKKSVASGKYSNPEKINLFTDGVGDNHPVIKEYNLAGYPSPILVDATGRIAKMRNGDLRTKEGLIASIEALLNQGQSSAGSRQ